MDNFKFDIAYCGEESLKSAFKLLGGSHKVVGYRESEKGLIFYWVKSKREGYMPLPYPFDLDQAAYLAIGWLNNTKYGPEPDHDGDNEKGWRIYNESWGHVDGEYQAFIAVQPVWAVYGK